MVEIGKKYFVKKEFIDYAKDNYSTIVPSVVTVVDYNKECLVNYLGEACYLIDVPSVIHSRVKGKEVLLSINESGLIPTPEHDSLQYVANEHIKAVSKMEETVLLQIFEQCLSRKVVVGDYKRFTKIYQSGINLDYDLAFDGVVIGKVVFNLGIPTAAITFNPIKS